MVVGSNLARDKIFTASIGSVDSLYPSVYTVSHFSYAPLFQGPHFLTKMLESNILYDTLLIDILSV